MWCQLPLTIRNQTPCGYCGKQLSGSCSPCDSMREVSEVTGTALAWKGKMRAGQLMAMTLNSCNHDGLPSSGSQIAWLQNLQKVLCVNQLWTPNPMICFCFPLIQEYRETTCRRVSYSKPHQHNEKELWKALFSMVSSKYILIFVSMTTIWL